MTSKTKNKFVVEAIFSIRPNSEFLVADTYESLSWISKDQEKPTQTEFEDALAIVKAGYDSKQYQRDRIYPSIGDQLDLIYWDKVNKTEIWKETIEAVKKANPKP